MNIKDFIYFILILIIAFSFLKLNTESNRYTIINGDFGVILLDKQLGLTWRQVSRNKGEPASYWQEMEFLGTLENNVSKGFKKEHKRLQKSLGVKN